MNKKKKHIFSKLIIPIVAVLVVAYLVISAFLGMRNAYPTEVVYTDTAEDSLSAYGWVIRSEVPLNGGTGLVQLQRDQEEKVGKGQIIAVVYQDEAYIDHQNALAETAKELSALQYATYDQSPSGVTLDALVMASMTTLKHQSSSGNFTSTEEVADVYRKQVLRREFLMSSQAAAEMSYAGTELTNQYNQLMISQSGTNTITAPASGVFSSYLDGYETILYPDKLKGIDPEGLEAFSQLTPQSVEGCIGKLITGTTWYYAIPVDGETAQQFEAGNSAEIYFDSLSETLPMTVESVSETENGQAVVVFSSARDVESAGELRQETGRVVFHSATGLHVAKNALHVDEDGTTGVYVVSGHFARFRPVKVLAESNTFYIVKPAPTSETDTRILKAGDAVILAEDTVYDGKVVR